MDWSATVRRCFDSDRVLYTGHARREMRREESGLISDSEIHQAISQGETIETYPEDTPYPSALLHGTTDASRPLHAVCAYDEEGDRLIVVTVYEPSRERWLDYRRRRT